MTPTKARSKASDVPELMGASEVAAELGIARTNLGAIVGLPEPVQVLRRGAIWRAAEIREFAAERRKRNAA